MRSDMVKKGVARAPHRSLFKALGFIEEELDICLSALCLRKVSLYPDIFIWGT